MKIALLGYGKMGKMIEKMAEMQKIEVAAKFWDEKPLKTDSNSTQLLEEVDVLLDFSIPDAVPENVKKAAALKKNIVIGTTGWQKNASRIQKMVEDNKIGCVYAPNFSIGVNLFYKIVEFAARTMLAFEQYDPYLTESHHKFKLDAPSGTALAIKSIISNIYRTNNIPISSIRAGYIPGIHQVAFDSNVDFISLKHTARNREGLAIGALTAAQWICGRKGYHAFEDVLNDILEKK